ncbi:MAG: sulfurtransferase [Saprospiraceae bacterium]|nr:sulfurtransferase [Candidatus Opimibacter iunctus]
MANQDLPKEKQTTLGLYVTSKEAHAMWLSAPREIKIIDVRTPEEYIFIGHAQMAWNIPLAFQTYEWEAEKDQLKFKPNPDFLEEVQAISESKDTLLVMCRSGGRSAMAINALAKAGYTHVYQITDGMEGDPVSDPESDHYGQRLINGWKNAGLPWTYVLNHERMILPKE